MKRILLVAGGTREKSFPTGPWDSIVGADSGGDALFAWNQPAHLIIGDLDSISPEALSFHREKKSLVQSFPTDKNQTDLELALISLPDDPFSEIHLAGLFGGRFDHALMNLQVLSRYTPKGFFTFNVENGCGGIFRPGTLTLAAPEDAQTALIAQSEIVEGIESTGVKWPLHQEVLRFGESRGVSNRIKNPPWRISTRAGVLLWLIMGVSRADVEIGWHPAHP